MPNSPSDADPVDGRAGRAEPRELEDDDLCARARAASPSATGRIIPTSKPDEDPDAQEDERLTRGDRARVASPAQHRRR